MIVFVGAITAADTDHWREDGGRNQPSRGGGFPRNRNETMALIETKDESQTENIRFCLQRWSQRWLSQHAHLWQTTKPWTMHIIRWAAENQMQNIYTNFEGKSSLCANYREPGRRLPRGHATVTTGYIDICICCSAGAGLHFHGKAQGADTKIITSWDETKDG